MRATTDERESVNIGKSCDGRICGHVAWVWGCAVALEWTRPQFGGKRPWFVCPKCSRRCGVLFREMVSGGATCRICAGLVYPSQRERAFSRLLRRCSRIRRRLGWPPGVAHGESERPSGMHRSTYIPILEEYRYLLRCLNIEGRLLVDRFKAKYRK